MADLEPPTEDEVFAYIDGIPPKLRRCASATHDWQPHDWTAYTAAGKVVQKGGNLSRARTFDVIEACGGRNGCGLKRHYTITVSAGRITEQTGYTYSERNEHLISPQGVSQTGISVRRTMRGQMTLARILGGNRVHLAPQGETKRALRSVRGVA